MKEFVDFFGTPNPKTPIEKAQIERQAYLERCKEVVTAQAAELVKPSQELARILTEKEVPPDVSVVLQTSRELPGYTEDQSVLGRGGADGKIQAAANRLRVAKNHAWARDKAHKAHPYHAHKPDQEIAQGWVISEVSTRYKKHTVILTEAGEIKVGSPQYEPFNPRKDYAKDKAYEKKPMPEKNPVPKADEPLREVIYEGTVNLAQYPFYETFNTVNGHMQADGNVPSLARPDAARDGPNKKPPLVPYTPETYIASNLESIERGLRETGQVLISRL